MSGLPGPVHDGLFEVSDGGVVRLLAGRCQRCATPQFPRPPACAACGGPTDELRLDGRGASLWAWTSVAAAPPGYEGPVPYGFGVVELPQGLRVVTRLTEADPDRLTFAQPMMLVAEVVATDEQGDELETWSFAPAVDNEVGRS